MRSQIALVALVVLAALGAGCYRQEVPVVEPPSCADDVVEQPTKVDLLVVVDNSNSMAEEQAALSSAIGPAIRELTAPPDADGDGLPDHPALVDLHVGIVDTDMGTGGYAVQTCRDAADGDDGVLRHAPNGEVEGCREQYPRFLEWAEGNDPEAFAADFECIATLGTGGCGFEQQVAAAREALTTHAAPGGANEGFLREDSLLAILFVTDEDDGTIRGDIANATDIFNTQLQLGPLNLRAYTLADEYLEPAGNLAEQLLALRGGHPERLLVAGIVGVPVNAPRLGPEMTEGDFAALLDEPTLQQVIDDSPEGRGERLVPSCDVAGTGEAFPPRRILETLRAVEAAGGTGMAQSICQDDWTGVMESVVTALQARFGC
jgi:hypothetical protein